MRRYTSPDEDSGRWDGFPFRLGDVVISTRSKSGTTWLQLICTTLVLGTAELPATLAELSPWLDHLVEPRDAVLARLGAQDHRRVIKTHTPLDGVPVVPGVTYVVTARDPLDLAVSLYHHSANIDRARLAELTGVPQAPRTPPPLHEWLVRWIHADVDPAQQLDSLPGVLFHLSDAWDRRASGADVVLVHYDDLLHDLDGGMRRIAARLGVDVDEARWPSFVRAATFAEMSARADRFVPDTTGVLKDNAAFFRRGRSGAAREILSAEEVGAYHRRAAQLAPPDVLAWLHRDLSAGA